MVNSIHWRLFPSLRLLYAGCVVSWCPERFIVAHSRSDAVTKATLLQAVMARAHSRGYRGPGCIWAFRTSPRLEAVLETDACALSSAARSSVSASERLISARDASVDRHCLSICR